MTILCLFGLSDFGQYLSIFGLSFSHQILSRLYWLHFRTFIQILNKMKTCMWGFMRNEFNFYTFTESRLFSQKFLRHFEYTKHLFMWACAIWLFNNDDSILPCNFSPHYKLLGWGTSSYKFSFLVFISYWYCSIYRTISIPVTVSIHCI